MNLSLQGLYMIDFNKLIKSSKIDSANDRSFLQRIFKNGVDPYVARLKQYKFTESGKVLDAGCGFGQWSLALAHLNKEVYACDADSTRVAFLERIASANKITNINIMQGFIDNLPFENDYFDTVFCYGVLYTTLWKKSLSELVRVLKPGGKIYVNANGIGWFKHLWYTEPNITVDYVPRKFAAEAWLNTYRYQIGDLVDFSGQIIIEPSELIDEMQGLGLINIVSDGEGLLGNPQNKDVFFKKEYYGDTGVYEIIGEKR